MKKRAKGCTREDERAFLLSIFEYALIHAEAKVPDCPTKEEVYAFLFPEGLNDPESIALERRIDRALREFEREMFSGKKRRR